MFRTKSTKALIPTVSTMTLSTMALLASTAEASPNSPNSIAQSQAEAVTIEEALRICNRIKNSRDRLDCFEGLADAAAPESETTARNDQETDIDIKIGDGEGSGSEIQTPQIAAPAEKLDSTDESKSTSRKRFVILPEEEAKERLDKFRTPREKGEAYTSTVRKAWFNNERKLMVLMNNGEIWKQSQGKKPRKPKPGAEVNFKKTRLGSWFVKFPPNSNSVRMRIINP